MRSLTVSLWLFFSDEFVPEDGQAFELIDAMNLTGEFQTVQTLGLDTSYTATVSYVDNAVSISINESGILLGDVNCDGVVNLLDVSPFVSLLANGEYQDKADINQDGGVNLLDVSPFVFLLSGQ